MLATQRVMSCLQQQCEASRNCNLSIYCSKQVFSAGKLSGGNAFTKITTMCLDEDTTFGYGIYKPLLVVYAGNTLAVRILYPIYWGLINLG